MKQALALLLLVHSAPARAEWTAQDTVLEGVGAALHLIDYSQTLRIARSQPENYSAQVGGKTMWFHGGARLAEANPILGAHPSDAAVTAYFAGTLAAHAAIAYVLPRPYRTAWQCMWIGAGAYSVGHNFSAGVRLDFP